jgi:hypothetical protein
MQAVLLQKSILLHMVGWKPPLLMNINKHPAEHGTTHGSEHGGANHAEHPDASKGK